MQHAVAVLFAHIIRFAQRAVNWYTEGRIRHIYHAITQPASLRYSDLISSISVCTQRIDNLAADAAQAEQRNIHNVIIEIQHRMTEFQNISLPPP